ncbi:MAG: xanthine dehydrogenase family protein subunit M [Candidatus Dormibacteraeota bacterium]|jgi:carbon-monoxide dehydrogenase medium subunit|nr:xanthine dehydrogenase family protein subunit M [Candidatus Dormibacteraeota bacterium]
MQTPAPFEYSRASSVESALALLERYGPDTRLIAGGHSLLPMMKLRLARPERLVDINDIPDLDHIRLDGGEIAIGAMARHADLLASPLLGRNLPIFADAERVIADPIVRNRGTIGGSLCQGDPAEDLAAVVCALGAELVVRSSGGSRRVPAREFYQGPFETVLGPSEMLTEVRIPLRPGQGSAYEKVERRTGDWAVAAVGCCVTLDGDRISQVGIGLAAVNARQFAAPEAEARLMGRPPSSDDLATAAQLAAEHSRPQTDQRGPQEYKRYLVAELTKRSLVRAVDRARAGGLGA